MASPGELVKVAAWALLMPEVTVGSYYRALREAALVSKLGRGRSAAEVTALDAARLLIAIMSAPLVRDSAECVSLYGRFRSAAMPDDIASAGLDPDLAALEAAHAFEDALAYLLENISDDPDRVRQPGERFQTTAAPPWVAKIECNQLAAWLTIGEHEFGYYHPADRRLPENLREMSRRSELRRLAMAKWEGLGTTRYVKWKTLAIIGAYVRGETSSYVPRGQLGAKMVMPDEFETDED